MRNILRLFVALLLAGVATCQVLPPVQPTPLQVSRYTNIGNDAVIDNRSQFISQNNMITFCASGTGFWSVQFQYANASSTGPWTTPGGVSNVDNFSSNCIGWFLGYRNFYRFHITGSAVVAYSAVKDFWIPDGAGGNQTQTLVPPYITAATASPQLILQTTHLQGVNADVVCYSGPVVNGVTTGHEVYCDTAKTVIGDVTVQWAGTSVQSIMVFSPSNSLSHLYSGPVPYVVNAATSPQLIPAFTHGQGTNVVTQCFSGMLTADFHVTGLNVLCQTANDGQGNITVTWFDNTVGSIMVSSAGPGPPGPSGLGATPYVVNAATSPQVILQTTHFQGYNPITTCYGGVLLNGHITGTQYPCTVAMDPSGSGNVTVSWTGSAVGSIMVQTSGRPAPYVVNASTSPMSILVGTHNQGYSATAKCFDGPLISGVVTGNEVVCAVHRNSSGDIVVTYGGGSVVSISIQ